MLTLRLFLCAGLHREISRRSGMRAACEQGRRASPAGIVRFMKIEEKKNV